ncbi:cell envelope integrity protein CreD [Sphingomonas sp. ST-64]|uniref:Cell envelope integrity protein CreD n=1 Tax=Sphingomonas plantiphila TaxID=3163295 RepID=A0ABW8YLB2_9SPHN
MELLASDRSPGMKLLLSLLVAAVLTIPVFTVYLLVYDRQNQSETARSSIAEGWGGPQILAGPLIVIPYQEEVSRTVQENGRPMTRTSVQRRELFLAPATLDLDTKIKPERRSRSIYEAVVYDADISGAATFRLPADTARIVDIARLEFDKAELRFGVADPRGLKPVNRIAIDGRAVPAQPGNGPAATNGSGFFASFDAARLRDGVVTARFAYALRGHSVVSLAPRAGATRWSVTSPWQHPSFTGGFLPESRNVTADGFSATYRISNLALGMTLVGTSGSEADPRTQEVRLVAEAQVGLIQPVDLYAQVNRSVKYGFLFIGFTFMAFLLFDVVASVRVSVVEYLLVGAGLVLFFVLLLAFAEVIGFTPAYIVAAGGVIALLTAYSAAVLGSRHRAGFIAGLLVALYGVLYILLSLEAYSLLIGSLLLFAALAAVMYLTRNLDWGGRAAPPLAA